MPFGDGEKKRRQRNNLTAKLSLNFLGYIIEIQRLFRKGQRTKKTQKAMITPDKTKKGRRKNMACKEREKLEKQTLT